MEFRFITMLCSILGNKYSDRHVLPPILCDTATILVFVDQCFCHCVLIYSISTDKSLTSLHGSVLYVSAYSMSQSCETINQIKNHVRTISNTHADRRFLPFLPWLKQACSITGENYLRATHSGARDYKDELS